MRILFLSWYDRKNPASGGAEKLGHEVLKRLVERGHEATWFASRFIDFKDGKRVRVLKKEEVDGVKIVRRGGRVGTVFAAFFWYLKHRREFDVVIDNFHAFSFLTPLYVGRSKRLSMIYEVAGTEIWMRMQKFPLNAIGIILEKILFRILYKKEKFITISESTKEDLKDEGVSERNVDIIPMGIEQHALSTLPKKTEFPSLVYFGGLRRMKRVEDQLEALSILRKEFSKIKFYILGRKSGLYYEFLKKRAYEIGVDNYVEFVGFLSNEKRDELIQRSWVNLGTSVKEGWGLVVNEANALGTPTVAYNVQGYRDSLKHYKNGLLTITKTPDSLATGVKRLILDKVLYEKLQIFGLNDSRKLTLEKSTDVFEKIVYEKLNGGKETNLARQELVSVVIPVLNGGSDFEKCLESVKAQTYRNIEIVVVDGGSKDESVKVAKSFGARVFKWENRGRTAQKNKGAKTARGKYLYFIDADFVLNKNVVKSAVMSLKERGYDMIAVHNVSDPKVSVWSRIRKFERDFFEYDTYNISPRFLTKKAFEKVSGFDEELVAGEDYDIYNRLKAERFKLGFITEKELHLGEPKTLKEVINKHFYYGKTLASSRKAGGKSKLAKLTFAQKSPVKPAYIRKFYRFLFRPDLTLGLIFYNIVRFTAGGIGYLAGMLKRGRV